MRRSYSKKKQRTRLFDVAIVLGASVLIGCGIGDSSEFRKGGSISNGPFMEYEGERFRTSKEYNDWDEFKEDPNNYLPSETDRMQEAVRKVEFLQSASNLETLVKHSLEKQFPGFGCGQLGQLDRNQPNACYAFFIAIPRSELHRYAGYAKINGRFELVADFVAAEIPMIAMVAVNNGHLKFYGMDKSELHSFPLPNSKQ